LTARVPTKGKTAQPAIRVLHHMARSGGTVISKCLATMDGVVLLSEIHPAGIRMFNPLQQAHEWFGLLADADLRAVQNGGIGFQEGIALIHERCVEQGKILLLRDWTHLDFTAVPFLSRPSYQLTLADVLKERLPLVNTTTVRHPIHQWRSLSQLPIMREKLTLDTFLEGYRRFAEYCVQIGFIRFEDFTDDTERQLRILCGRLAINYDEAWRERWGTYTKITGDSGRQQGKAEIKPPSHKTVEPALLNAFANNADYRHSLKLLGYEHPL